MYILEFKNYLQSEKRFSPLTVQAYLFDINQFLDFIHLKYGFTDVALINHKMIRSWIVDLIKVKKIATRSIHRKRSALKTYYRFLRLTQIVTTNPMAKVIAPKTSKTLPTFVALDAMETLGDMDMFTDDFTGTRDRLVIELLYQTGMRLSELLSITVDDIQGCKGKLKVLGKRNKERILPIRSSLLELVCSYLSYKENMEVFTPILIVTAKGKPAILNLYIRL